MLHITDLTSYIYDNTYMWMSICNFTLGQLLTSAAGVYHVVLLLLSWCVCYRQNTGSGHVVMPRCPVLTRSRAKSPAGNGTGYFWGTCRYQVVGPVSISGMCRF
jgi:hypothetical protein